MKIIYDFIDYLYWFLDYYGVIGFLKNYYIYIILLFIIILVLLLIIIIYKIVKNNKWIFIIKNKIIKTKNLHDITFNYEDKEKIFNILYSIDKSLKVIKNIILIYFIWLILYYIIFVILPLIWVISFLSSVSHT